MLNGSKIWITNGGFADVFTVFARTSRRRGGREAEDHRVHRRARMGVKSGPKEHKLGIRGQLDDRALLRGRAVPPRERARRAGPRLQGRDGGARTAGASALASGCVGAVQARHPAWPSSAAQERRAFGRTIGEFGLIKDKIAIDDGRDLRAREHDVPDRPGWSTAGRATTRSRAPICKVYGTETCWRVVNEALQIAAGIGYMADYPYERLLRDARINLIFEGTNEILRASSRSAACRGPGGRSPTWRGRCASPSRASAC